MTRTTTVKRMLMSDLPRPRLQPWLSTAACCVSLLLPNAAVAADAPPAAPAPVLRHMVFKVGVTTLTDREMKRTAIESTNMAGNHDHHRGSEQASGIVTADVVAAPPDQTLIVDVSEDAQARKAPRVRAVIYPDGRVGVERAQNVTEEEVVLLRFLARGLIKADPGNGSFAMPSGKDTQESMTYRVAGTDPKGRLKLSLDGAVHVRGGQPYDGTIRGNAVYDEAKAVPILVQFALRTQRSSLEQLDTTDMQIDFDLQEDSFGAV